MFVWTADEGWGGFSETESSRMISEMLGSRFLLPYLLHSHQAKREYKYARLCHRLRCYFETEPQISAGRGEAAGCKKE